MGHFASVTMADSSGGESDKAPGIDWARLENELSAGALQSLQQHLQVMELIDLSHRSNILQLDCITE